MSFGGDSIIFAYLDIFIKLVIIHVIKLSMKIKKNGFSLRYIFLLWHKQVLKDSDWQITSKQGHLFNFEISSYDIHQVTSLQRK